MQIYFTNQYIRRKNIPTHTGRIAAIKDGWALIWWDEDISRDAEAPPNPVPLDSITPL